MNVSNTIPDRSGYGDLFSLFIIILAIALGMQGFSEVTRISGLRNGVEIEGRWIDNYIEPQSSTPMVVYSFTVDGETHRNRQVIPEEYSDGYDSGDPVMIVYLPQNPETSQLAGTASVNFSHILQFVLSLVVAIFAVQYYFALKTQRSAWVLIIWNRLQPQKGRLTTRDSEA